MKKTIPITLSKTLFYIEEDAYHRLSRYLDSIKEHFSSYADSAEIISDIEDRITERFLENKNKDKIVTLADVEALIASMGEAKDFGAEGEQVESEENIKHLNKKLFRNPDDVIIAGVASGLAAYFGLDATLVRLLFVLSVIFGGSGVLIYIILWLVMPEAKTPTEKLQMRGERVTLESVQELAKEKVEEVKAHKGIFRKIVNFPFLVLRKIAKIILPFVRALLGFFITLLSGAGIFALFFVFFIVLFNLESPYVDFPLMQMGNHFLIYLGILAVFFSILVPALFVIFLGLTILKGRNFFHSAAVFSLLGVWCLSLILLGVISTRLIPEYQNYTASSPLFESVTTDLPLADFSGVSVRDGNKVDISMGEEFKVSVSGSERSMEELSTKVEDNILQIGSKRNFRLCFFCGDRTPEISVVLPEINTLSLANGSRVTASLLTARELSVDLANGSNAKLSLEVQDLEVEVSNASFLSLSGKAETSTLFLENGSNISAYDLITENTTITAENGSMAEIYAEKTLQADLQNGSRVIYDGNPKIEKVTKSGSRLEKK